MSVLAADYDPTCPFTSYSAPVSPAVPITGLGEERRQRLPPVASVPGLLQLEEAQVGRGGAQCSFWQCWALRVLGLLQLIVLAALHNTHAVGFDSAARSLCMRLTAAALLPCRAGRLAAGPRRVALGTCGA